MGEHLCLAAGRGLAGRYRGHGAGAAPWKEAQGFAVNIDLSESGLLEKTGLEVFGRWRHPLLVDKFIERLEDAGLCLPSKGRRCGGGFGFCLTAIPLSRRWLRILN